MQWATLVEGLIRAGRPFLTAMNVLRVKLGVSFEYNGKAAIAPGGFVLLAAFLGAAQSIGHDVTLTSACDGAHSGPDDPHHEGKAYDVRTHDVPDKDLLLSEIGRRLDPAFFFVFLEDKGTANEHIHGQVRKGITYPPEDSPTTDQHSDDL